MEIAAVTSLGALAGALVVFLGSLITTRKTLASSERVAKAQRKYDYREKRHNHATQAVASFLGEVANYYALHRTTPIGTFIPTREITVASNLVELYLPEMKNVLEDMVTIDSGTEQRTFDALIAACKTEAQAQLALLEPNLEG